LSFQLCRGPPQLSCTKTVDHDDHACYKHGQRRSEPQRRIPWRQHCYLETYARFIPDPIVIGALDSKTVVTGGKLSVSCRPARAIDFVPFRLQSLQPIPVTVSLRIDVAEGREPQCEDALFMAQSDPFSRP